MARIRTIKPEFWTNEKVTECSMAARLFFIAMWNFADDEGRLVESAKTLKMQIFPGDDITSSQVSELLTELSVNRLIIRYESDGKRLIQITGWDNQVINRKNPSKLSAPSVSDPLPITEQALPEGKGREGKEKPEANASGKKSRAAKTPVDPDFHPKPETVETIVAAGTRPEDVEPERIAFIDRNIARGERYVDHDAAFRNWCRNSLKFARERRSQGLGQRSSPQGSGGVVRAAMAVIAANRERGIRPDGVPGDGATDLDGAGGDTFAFEGFDAPSRPGPGDPGINEMLAGHEVARKAG